MAIVTGFFWGIYFCLFSFVPTGCYICSYLQVIWNLLPRSSWPGYATCSNPHSRRRMLFRKGWKRYSSRCLKLWFLDLLGLQDRPGTLQITWVRWQWPWANLGPSKIFSARFWWFTSASINYCFFCIFIFYIASYFRFQADNLRQQTLQQLQRILTTRQSARALLAIHDYFSRLRALSSLWLARPQE